MNSKYILWLDVETTGLELSDELLEVAVIITDWNLIEISKKGWVINQAESIYNKMNNYVQKMHTNNGLWKEVRESTLTKEAVEYQIMKFLLPFMQKGAKFVVGGNSISFDKQIIEHHLPLLFTFFHHRIIDVTSILMLVEKWLPEKYKLLTDNKTDHRVMKDIERCVESLKLIKSQVFINLDNNNDHLK